MYMQQTDRLNISIETESGVREVKWKSREQKLAWRGLTI